MPNTATLDFLRGKTSLPTDLRTAELDRLPLEIRERSFFMAAVEDAEILDRFRGEVEAVAAGDRSMSEAKVRLHDFLKARGYQPLPGQEGTIKDLRSLRRMTVALETNVEAARSYGQWARQQSALAAFPAVQYKRGRQARVPRDWPSRWNAAREATAAAGATLATSEDDMFCLANHPLLTDPIFNRFGSPWTPYDFGSGMMLKTVSRAKAIALGLIPQPGETSEEADFLRELMQPQSRSLNESLEARPAVASQELRDALGERLLGLAKWADDVLIFTDPNGTRATTESDLVDTWSTPLPTVFHDIAPDGLLQRQAVLDFADDPETFASQPDRNQWADLARAVGRIAEPEKRHAIVRTIADGNATGWLADLASSPLWRRALQVETPALRAVSVLRAIKALF